MTIAEMHVAIQQGLQRMGSYDFSDMLPEEIDLQINRMQERFVKQRFDVSIADPQGFQQTQKRLDDIRTVIVNDFQYTQKDEYAEYTNTTADFTTTFFENPTDDEWFVVLPTNYMFLINVRVLAIRGDNCDPSDANASSDAQTFEVDCRITKRNLLPKMQQHPFGKSRYDSPLATIVDNRLYVHGDGVFRVTGFIIDYIERPTEVKYGSRYLSQSNQTSTQGSNTDIDCDLPLHTHNEIVDMTVQHIAGVIQAQTYQTHVVENQQNE